MQPLVVLEFYLLLLLHEKGVVKTPINEVANKWTFGNLACFSLLQACKSLVHFCSQKIDFFALGLEN